jgi:uncharacterized protein (DUF885 family)
MSLYSKYFDEYIKLFPSLNDYLQLPKYKNLQIYYENSISDDYVEKIRKFTLKYKNILKKKKTLNIYDTVMKYELDTTLEGIDYPLQLMPLTQMENGISDYIQNVNGTGVYVFKTKKDYTDFMLKNKDFSVWCNQVIVNLQRGILEGFVIPSIIANMLIKDIDSLMRGKSYTNKNVPKEIKSKWDNNIKLYVITPINTVLEFLKNVYLSKCRPTLGYSSLKNGKNMYEYIVKTQTTNSSMSIKQIHDLGLSEVKRIRQEIKKIMKNMNYKKSIITFMNHIKTLKENKYKNKKELLEDYKRIRTYLWDNIIPEFFEIKIKKTYTIKEVPSAISGSMAGAYYVGGSLTGTRDGIFYLNTRDVKGMLKSDALVLSKHEGIPGHHFQITYVNENKKIPMFIKAGNYTGYIEGWALYAEQIGEYENNLETYGKLNSEMLRAVRLVVDTGLHYYNWTYKQSYKIFKDNTTFPDSEIKSEIYRYVAMPGQALSYKIGELTILNLKNKYMIKHNNIKKFHKLVLENGPLPLDILIKKLKTYT